MRSNLKITFKDGQATNHVIQYIEKYYDKLRRKNRSIINCQVIIDRPHHKHGGAEKFSVSVHLVTPGQDLVGHSKSSDHAEGDLFSSISEAFAAIRAQTGPRSRLSKIGTRSKNFARKLGRQSSSQWDPVFN